MDIERMQFFVTCPKCKHKFGTLFGIVLKYLDRLLRQIAKEANGKPACQECKWQKR